MITKQKYIEYLISTPINYTCTNLAEYLDTVSHDVISFVGWVERSETHQLREL
ncbi:MAG: hypothetical protein LUQ18_09840 [Methylococcaceae bacterium]|nr:hypothetical protein [Methylococcaceae bacterium]